MAEIDTALALKQSVALILTLSAAIGLVNYIFSDTLVSGILYGFLMAVLILLFYYWSNMLGNPEHAGWPFNNK
ncbi:hypothetical protein ACLI4U_01540 [Natrialbaceae archaeon A-CW2]|uniref:hypothetical protein n=1 Tax=Natronosalvus amylolyticus TaxID=2961994 RepID=UPI0020CA1C04|nr:hypothetical protein [Natronosalvus amylolyticus]